MVPPGGNRDYIAQTAGWKNVLSEITPRYYGAISLQSEAVTFTFGNGNNIGKTRWNIGFVFVIHAPGSHRSIPPQRDIVIPVGRNGRDAHFTMFVAQHFRRAHARSSAARGLTMSRFSVIHPQRNVADAITVLPDVRGYRVLGIDSSADMVAAARVLLGRESACDACALYEGLDLQAAQAFDKAYELASANEDTLMLARVQVNRAELYLKRQQYEHARQSCDDAFAIYSRLGAKSGLGEAYKFYGVFYRETGKSHLADIHLDLAFKLAESAQNPLLQA